MLTIDCLLIPSSEFSDYNDPELGQITDEYLGYFVNISYRNYIVSGDPSSQVVFSKERFEAREDGNFIISIPQKDDILDKLVTFEINAPDGEVLLQETYSAEQLYPGNTIQEHIFEITVDPKSVVQPQPSSGNSEITNLNGRVIDLNGEKTASNLQVILWATTQANDQFDPKTYSPIFTAQTDKHGYFFGQYPTNRFLSAYGTIAGIVDQPIPINLESVIEGFGKFPKTVLLALDLSQVDIDSKGCGCEFEVPRLPNTENLIGAEGTFSQDLGGGCVDFTIPNRTLEEFSFYHVVRTTEPEIKSLTITLKEIRLKGRKLTETVDKVHKIATRTSNASKANKLNELYVDSVEVKPTEIALPNDSGTQKKTKNPTSKSKIVQPPPLASYVGEIAKESEFAVTATADMIDNRISEVRKAIEKALGEIEKRKREINSLEESIETAPITRVLIISLRRIYRELKDNISEFQSAVDDYNNLYQSYGSYILVPDTYILVNYSAIKNELDALLKDTEFTLKEIDRIYAANHPGRVPVSIDNPIDWDEDPTICQNTTIAHGHLLHFKQVWKANGYSLGDLLYSLPLAPCQKKQIAIFDWGRSESASRTEDQTVEEKLSAYLSRDRDVSEVMNSAFSEKIKAGSKSKVKSRGFKLGGSISFPGKKVLGGISGGFSSSKGSASVTSHRKVTPRSHSKVTPSKNHRIIAQYREMSILKNDHNDRQTNHYPRLSPTWQIQETVIARVGP